MSYTPPPAGGPSYPQQPYRPPQPLNPSDERLWGMLSHVISGGVNLVTGLGAGFIAAIVMFFVFKDRGPFVRAHVTTTLNFQITLIIATVIGYITTFIFIGFLILAAVGVVNIVFSIIAALKANQGEFYKYPLAIEFVK